MADQGMVYVVDDDASAREGVGNMVGASERFQGVLAAIQVVAPTGAAVLILRIPGEVGH
jgi:hypothetical protein